MEIQVPFDSSDCFSLSSADFQTYKIPEPPDGIRSNDLKDVLLCFSNQDQAIKYSLVLGDAYDELTDNCAKQKIRRILTSVNDQIKILK